MEMPVGDIAMAIEKKDVNYLSSLKGIGKRTAQKIVAALHGRTASFAAMSADYGTSKGESESGNDIQTGLMPVTIKQVSDQVVDVLVEQLGYTTAIARKMVAGALERNTAISTAEHLFDEVLKNAPLKRL